MAEQGSAEIPTWVLCLGVALIGLTSAGVKYGCDGPAPTTRTGPTVPKPIFDREPLDAVTVPAAVPTVPDPKPTQIRRR